MENEVVETPSLRDTLVASIAEHAEPVEKVEAVEETETQKADRLRDEAGRFAKAEQAKTEAPQAAPPQVEAAPPIQRPSSWKKEMWPIWDKMAAAQPLTDKEARRVAEYNAQREQQFATGVSTYKQIAESAKPLMEAIQPFQADIERIGVPTPQFVHRVLSDYKALAQGSPQDKLRIASNLMRECGIPLEAFYNQEAEQRFLSMPHTPQPQPSAPPPNIEALIEQAISSRETKQTVESMAKDTQKYPFFNYVRADMAQLLEQNEATDLHDAYLKALDLPQHAMLTPVMQQQQTQVAEAERLAKAQTVARVARTNAVSPKSATPASQAAPSGGKGVRDALREAIATHAGGARV